MSYDDYNLKTIFSVAFYGSKQGSCREAVHEIMW